jgi:hypothetical protein
MRRLSVIHALAAFTLSVAPLVSPAVAGSVQKQGVPATQHGIGSPFLLGGDGSGAGFRGPNVSTALSTALSVNGPSRRNPNAVLSPSVQVAVGTAVSIDGNASAIALDRTGDR